VGHDGGLAPVWKRCSAGRAATASAASRRREKRAKIFSVHSVPNNRARGPRQRGEGRLGCVIWLLLVAAVVYVGYVIVPVRLAASRFEDVMQEQAAFGSSRGNPEMIQDLLKAAQEQEIPLTKEQIEIVRTRESITISVQYQRTLSFLGLYQYVWKFNPVVQRPISVG